MYFIAEAILTQFITVYTGLLSSIGENDDFLPSRISVPKYMTDNNICRVPTYFLTELDKEVSWDWNHCRQYGETIYPWCYTEDPEIPWEYCTFSICSGKITRYTGNTLHSAHVPVRSRDSLGLLYTQHMSR